MKVYYPDNMGCKVQVPPWILKQCQHHTTLCFKWGLAMTDSIPEVSTGILPLVKEDFDKAPSQKAMSLFSGSMHTMFLIICDSEV